MTAWLWQWLSVFILQTTGPGDYFIFLTCFLLHYSFLLLFFSCCFLKCWAWHLHGKLKGFISCSFLLSSPYLFSWNFATFMTPCTKGGRHHPLVFCSSISSVVVQLTSPLASFCCYKTMCNVFSLWTATSFLVASLLLIALCLTSYSELSCRSREILLSRTGVLFFLTNFWLLSVIPAFPSLYIGVFFDGVQ